MSENGLTTTSVPSREPHAKGPVHSLDRAFPMIDDGDNRKALLLNPVLG